jgi:hypothetical protein
VCTVRRDELCRRFMAVPGVGPVAARKPWLIVYAMWHGRQEFHFGPAPERHRDGSSSALATT